MSRRVDRRGVARRDPRRAGPHDDELDLDAQLRGLDRRRRSGATGCSSGPRCWPRSTPRSRWCSTTPACAPATRPSRAAVPRRTSRCRASGSTSTSRPRRRRRSRSTSPRCARRASRRCCGGAPATSAARAAFEALLRHADTLVVDSSGSDGDDAAIRGLVAPPRRAAGVRVRDLAWLRLGPWQDMIAHFFDDPALLGELYSIRQLHIASGSEAEALYLGGWLASRLGWRPSGARRLHRPGRRPGALRAPPEGEIRRVQQRLPRQRHVVVPRRGRAETPASCGSGSRASTPARRGCSRSRRSTTPRCSSGPCSRRPPTRCSKRLRSVGTLLAIYAAVSLGDGTTRLGGYSPHEATSPRRRRRRGPRSRRSRRRPSIAPRGTEFEARLNTELSTKRLHDGDTFTLTEHEGFFHHAPAALKGATIDGHVENVSAGAHGPRRLDERLLRRHQAGRRHDRAARRQGHLDQGARAARPTTCATWA